MAVLDDFFPYVRSSFPEVPDALMRQAVRDAAIEFCERTRVIERRATLNVTAGQREQAFDLSEGEPFDLRHLRRDGSDLIAATRGEVNDLGDADGTPTHFYLEGSGSVVLWPTPTAAEALDAVATFRPSLDDTDVPDALLRDWREAIAGGAKMRLGRDYAPFRSEDAAQIGAMQFDRGVSRAIHLLGHGRTGQPVRARPTMF